MNKILLIVFIFTIFSHINSCLKSKLVNKNAEINGNFINSSVKKPNNALIKNSVVILENFKDTKFNEKTKARKAKENKTLHKISKKMWKSNQIKKNKTMLKTKSTKKNHKNTAKKTKLQNTNKNKIRKLKLIKTGTRKLTKQNLENKKKNENKKIDHAIKSKNQKRLQLSKIIHQDFKKKIKLMNKDMRKLQIPDLGALAGGDPPGIFNSKVIINNLGTSAPNKGSSVVPEKGYDPADAKERVVVTRMYLPGRE